MEKNMKLRQNPSPQSSPNNNGSSNNGGPRHPQFPQTPRPISRSESHPYPTTFVHADTNTFKRVVQMLTGASDTARQPHRPPPHDPPPKRTAPKRQSFKLYERRSQGHHFKNGVIVGAGAGNSGFYARAVLSPSVLNFPKLALNSPVTPLAGDPFGRSSGSSEEERAIAEKGFYLHPSPRDAGEPRLLPLFPVTSPGSFCKSD